MNAVVLINGLFSVFDMMVVIVVVLVVIEFMFFAMFLIWLSWAFTWVRVVWVLLSSGVVFLCVLWIVSVVLFSIWFSLSSG